jgi:hypothetical protein
MSTLTEQFLSWVADRPRSYAEAMEAWRSTCPRLSIWEDALGDELVRLDAGAGGLSEARRPHAAWPDAARRGDPATGVRRPAAAVTPARHAPGHAADRFTVRHRPA